MKAAVQIVVSTLALAGLLSGPASQAATDIAELPLKASVLAKPNVIFGLDDSGSMDSEVMLGNNDGAFWWDYNARSGWDATGKTWFNAGGGVDGQWKKMVYLFPNGYSDGKDGNRTYDDADNPHFAIPPTAQFAFLRSPDYNPIYFDPAVTYKPWSPAYVGSAVVNYGNASVTAAKSHPTYGSGTFNVRDLRAAVTTANWTFKALPGMLLPGTARVCVNNGCANPWPLVSAQGWAASGSLFVVPASTARNISMAYFPATYYLKEVCTVDGSACVTAPDGTTTLKRYEIKAANYATTAAYDAALQNFANWWQYYRKRKLMLNAAVGQVLEPLTGLRMGVVHFNNRPGATTRVTMYDIDKPLASQNGRKVAGLFYETNRAGGTPTRETLDRIGEEYMNAAGPIQYACQRNNAFIMSDGFANVATPTKPSYSKTTWGAAAPYATTHDNSLADVALSYYTVNLRTGLATGKVPKTAVDENTNLHMNTYGLIMGARGKLFTSDTALPPTDTSAWENPTQDRNPNAVDDLWHATINGRGQMYLADSPAETAAKIQSGLRDILSQTGAQGGIAVSTVNLSRGDQRAYFGTYNPAGWAGDLTANPIDVETAEVDTTPVWSAGTLLLARDWTTRVIAAGKAGGAVAFTEANVADVVNPSDVYGADAAVVNYLRGERTNEGTLFRSRTSLMGAVINSEPTVARDEGVVYVQSGEGMLHAFDTRSPNAGKELWAFVPESALGAIGETTERAYAFKTKLDGSPVVAKLSGGSKILVAGAGVAGRSFYALNVTSPRDLDEAGLAGKHLWTFPSAADTTTQAKMGQALGRPVVVKSANASDGDVVLLTSGFNNTDGIGRLWVLNATTGAVIHEFETGAGSASVDSGLAQVSAFQETNGTVRYVYGGDLLGNVWRFDLQDKGTPNLLAVLKGPAGDLQPVTAAPELVLTQGKRVVLIGTGRLLDIGDFGNTKVQSFYAIADGSSMANARSGLTQRTYNAGDDSLSGATVDWATGRGWYLDLPTGHQANSRPTLAYGAIAFVTNTNGGTDCAASSRLWVLDLLTGDEFSGTDYVSTVVSDVANSSGVTALLTADGKIIGSGQDADGKPWQRDITKNNPIQPAKNSWREIRRQ
jgi:type IV pilus assembly protein PilY1